MSREEPFLKRWSRRKQAKPAERAREETAAKPPAPAAEASNKTPAHAPGLEDGDPKVIAELPSIESLGKDSDYSGFMKKGVPEALRQQALRRLWASDPVLAGPDPLDLHNVDYTFLTRGGEVVKTAYQVGKGYVDAIAKAAEEKPGSAGEGEAAKEKEDAAEQDGPKDADAAASAKATKATKATKAKG